MNPEAWSLVDAQCTTTSSVIESSLQKGSKVKLIFTMHDNDSETQSTESLWVEILLVQEGKLLGQLEDDPKQIKCLQRGELIEFEERHIAEFDYVDLFSPNIKV